MPDQRATKFAQAAVQQLAKWRILFTGWQLGTRPKADPQEELRAELSALTELLIEKGLFSAAEYTVAVGREVELLDTDIRAQAHARLSHGEVIPLNRGERR